MQWFLIGVRWKPKGSKVKEGKENVEDQKKIKKVKGRLQIKNRSMTKTKKKRSKIYKE